MSLRRDIVTTSTIKTAEGGPAALLTASGYGDANSISSNHTADGHSSSRRVDVVSTEG